MHSDRSHHSVGLPHSEIRGSQPSYRLLSAYRRFSRPSSPLNAKASIMCPFSLGHAYLAPAGDRCMPGRTLRIRPPARVSLLTRAGDSILEIVLGSIQSCAPGRCTALKFRAAGVSGALRPTLHLSKKPDAEARGVVNDSEIKGCVKGVGRSRTGNLGHSIMG